MLFAGAAAPEPVTASAGFALDPGITAAIISASVALIVAIIAPVLQSWRQRRDAVGAKFDTAVGSLLLAQVARHFATGLADDLHPGTEAEKADYKRQVVEQGVSRFVDLMNAARASLAVIASYVPEVDGWLTSAWEISEADTPGMIDTIEKARSAAVKTERLFRSRKYAKQPTEQSAGGRWRRWLGAALLRSHQEK